VLILAHDLGYSDLVRDWQTNIKTPSLERLAREALLRNGPVKGDSTQRNGTRLGNALFQHGLSISPFL
jgi:hypothetical protein